MLNQVRGEHSYHVEREHLGLKRASQLCSCLYSTPIGNSEFSISVNGSCSHQIADFTDQLGIRLSSMGQRFTDMFKQSHTAIGSCQYQLCRLKSACFLFGHRVSESINVLVTGFTIKKNEGCIPGCCDYAICALVIIKCI